MKNRKRILVFITCLSAAGPCFATDTAARRGDVYVGLFGGHGRSSPATLRQQGTVYLAPPHLHPRLPIDANGSTGNSDLSFGGAHVGYEWDGWTQGSAWGLRPALELEGLYLGTHSPTGVMPVDPAFLGTQYVTIPMTAGVFLANAVITLRTPYSIHPYIGIGIGGALISIKDSDSANPSEPGINHFNSDPDSSDFAMAFQFKAGIKAELCENLDLFFEYRRLSIGATNHTFGATDYPGLHQPTAAWDIDLGRQSYNLFVVGLRLGF